MIFEFIDNNFYIVPMFAAILLALYGALMTAPRKATAADKNLVFMDEMDKPFDNYISNALYEMSFKPPFVWFIPDDPEAERAKDMNATISKANFDNIMNYRVFITAQTLIMIFATIVAWILSMIFNNSQVLLKLLFNVNTSGSTPTFVILLVVSMCLAMVPRLYIKMRADSRHSKFVGDLPVLQLFIILMIRSQRTIPEIFYVLSKSEMQYTEIFSNAYRIFLRDREQAFVYLRGAFHNTPFIDSLTVLETFDDYSKDDSANILQGQLESIIESVAVLKKNKNVLLGLITEGSIALPFMAIMLLGVVPIIFYGLDMMNGATSTTMGSAAELQ